MYPVLDFKDTNYTTKNARPRAVVRETTNQNRPIIKMIIVIPNMEELKNLLPLTYFKHNM